MVIFQTDNNTLMLAIPTKISGEYSTYYLEDSPGGTRKKGMVGNLSWRGQMYLDQVETLCVFELAALIRKHMGEEGLS